MRVNLLRLMIAANVAGLAIAGAGAWPTWRAWGAGGLRALVAAGAVVGLVMMVNALIAVAQSVTSPPRAAVTFAASSLIRVAIVLGLIGLGSLVLDVPARPFMVWASVFYAGLLLVEAFWLAGEVRRYAHQVALGRAGTAGA